jgi:hypothetical protein
MKSYGENFSMLKKIKEVLQHLSVFNIIPDEFQLIIDNKYDEDKILDELKKLKVKIDKLNIFKLAIKEDISIEELYRLQRICIKEYNDLSIYYNNEIYDDIFPNWGGEYDILYKVFIIRKFIMQLPYIGEKERTLLCVSINLIIIDIKILQELGEFDEKFIQLHHETSVGFNEDLRTLIELEREKEYLYNNLEKEKNKTYNKVLKDIDRIRNKWEGKASFNNFREATAYLLAEEKISTIGLAEKLELPKYTFVKFVHEGLIYLKEYNKLCEYFNIDKEYHNFSKYCLPGTRYCIE